MIVQVRDNPRDVGVILPLALSVSVSFCFFFDLLIDDVITL